MSMVGFSCCLYSWAGQNVRNQSMLEQVAKRYCIGCCTFQTEILWNDILYN